jgi:hypothetical protein
MTQNVNLNSMHCTSTRYILFASGAGTSSPRETASGSSTRLSLEEEEETELEGRGGDLENSWEGD